MFFAALATCFAALGSFAVSVTFNETPWTMYVPVAVVGLIYMFGFVVTRGRPSGSEQRIAVYRGARRSAWLLLVVELVVAFGLSAIGINVFVPVGLVGLAACVVIAAAATANALAAR